MLTWQAAYRGIVPDPYFESLSVKNLEATWLEGTPEIWVAEAERSIAGFVSFGPSRDLDSVPRMGDLEDIYVSPEIQRLRLRKIAADPGFSG